MKESIDMDRWTREMTADGTPPRLAQVPFRESPELPTSDDEVARYFYDERVSASPAMASSLTVMYAIERNRGKSVDDAFLIILEKLCGVTPS
jgi:hypothetical protein